MTCHDSASTYLGTVLLEPNRWAGDRSPAIRISEWGGRIASAGFDGIELWEKHVSMASVQEQAALRAGPLPITIFNSYAPMGAEGETARQQAAGFARELGANAM